MSGTKIRGKNFRISFLDTTQKPIAMAMECSYTAERTMLEANHKDNANYIEREPDVSDYTITGTSLLAWDPDSAQISFEFLKTAFDAGTPIDWEFQNTIGQVLSRSAFLSSLELSANNGEYVSDSWTLLANGADSLDVIP